MCAHLNTIWLMFSHVFSLTIGLPCPKGKFNKRKFTGTSAEGWSAVCEPCRPGFYYKSNFFGCKECGVGLYSIFQMSTVCSRCSTGKYGSSRAQFRCKKCPNGYYQHLEGYAFCYSSKRPGFASSGVSATKAPIQFPTPKPTSFPTTAAPTVSPTQYGQILGSSTVFKSSAKCVAGKFTATKKDPTAELGFSAVCVPCPFGKYSMNMLMGTGQANEVGKVAKMMRCMDCDQGNQSYGKNKPTYNCNRNSTQSCSVYIYYVLYI